MWPWGHLAVGYVCYSLFVRLRRGRSPRTLPTIVAAVGTQFPDLIDKPLAWSLGVLPSGRSLAHSLPVATAVLVVAGLYCRRQGRSELAVAFGVGYLTHIAGDAIGPFLAGQYRYLSFLGWPLLAPPPYGDEGGFVSQFASIDLSPFFVLQVAFALGVTALWVSDGAPGLPSRAALARRTRRADESDR